MRVFVTGGTGYVGTALIEELTEKGHEVRALVHNPAHRSGPRDATLIAGDLFDDESLLLGMEGVDAVIHLVGIIRENKSEGKTMERIHVEGTERVISAMKRSSITRLVHMSALGADETSRTSYFRSKGLAERAVKESDLDYTIVQPSVIFGGGREHITFIRQLADVVSSSPVVPVVGHGGWKLQPVALHTVVEVFLHALYLEKSVGKAYEVAGPDILTYRQILKEICSTLQRPYIPMPVPLRVMKVLVPLLEKFPFFPLTTDQLSMLVQGNVARETNRVYEDFCLPKLSFRVLPEDVIQK